MDARWRKLLDHARRAGCDSLVACTPENLFYMTGFWGEAIGILDENGATIVAPQLEAPRAAAESRNCDVVTADRGSGLIPASAKIMAGRQPGTDCRDHSTMMLLKKHIPNMKHQPAPFSDSRIIKDPGEVRILKKASAIIDGLFGVCAETMAAGQKESELQAVLMSRAMEREMFDTGYASTLNPLIIAGGPNGALPHAQVTSRRFRRGDLVVVDITLRYKGYISDATRTFAIGQVSQKAADIYGVVRESQELGIRATSPGKSCHEIDGACRTLIDERGYGEFFIHSTGHGIGLEVHEQPTVSGSSRISLERGMAITVEPGIYMPGKLGVRIEDSIMVGRRPSVMHKFTKELVRVG